MTTLLLLHMKYTRCTCHVKVSAYINDVVVSTWKYTICSLCMFQLVHDDYRTWGLYTKCTICMLWLLVHDGFICTIACYGIGSIIFLIVTVNVEYIIVVTTCHSVFQILIVLLHLVLLVSAVNCSWFLCMSEVQGEFGVDESWSSVTVWSRLQYESSTWTRNLDGDSLFSIISHLSFSHVINIKLIIKYTNDT